MGSQQLIYSATIANAAGDGPWVDVGGSGSEWSIHIENAGSYTVEVYNEIPVPTSPNPNMPSVQRPNYPPYGPPRSVTNYVNENHAIGATVTVTHAPAAGSTMVDNGVTFATGPQAGFALIYSPGGPAAPGRYSVNLTTGVYSFNATDVTNGYAVNVNYTITTPSSGFVLPAASATGPWIYSSGTHALVVAKSDLNVKWVRVRQAAPSTTLAFLHTSRSN
jgi:hypothetical protein